MKGIILMHIDEDGVRLIGRGFFEPGVTGLVRAVQEAGGKAYNFLPYWHDPAAFIRRLDGELTDIDYRDPKMLSMQFYDGKKRMIQDGIDEADICGWNLDHCIMRMEGLLLGENDLDMDQKWLQWTQKEYERVLHTRIPLNIRHEYCLH